MIKKRIAVLMLSFATLISFGKAIKGLGGYLINQGNPLLIATGLTSGIVFACLAIKIWKSYLNDIEKEKSKN
ncbi:MAG: hypothetical protein RR272_01145 [Synergistaceae bacterium]